MADDDHTLRTEALTIAKRILRHSKDAPNTQLLASVGLESDAVALAERVVKMCTVDRKFDTSDAR